MSAIHSSTIQSRVPAPASMPEYELRAKFRSSLGLNGVKTQLNEFSLESGTLHAQSKFGRISFSEVTDNSVLAEVKKVTDSLASLKGKSLQILCDRSLGTVFVDRTSGEIFVLDQSLTGTKCIGTLATSADVLPTAPSPLQESLPAGLRVTTEAEVVTPLPHTEASVVTDHTNGAVIEEPTALSSTDRAPASGFSFPIKQVGLLATAAAAVVAVTGFFFTRGSATSSKPEVTPNISGLTPTKPDNKILDPAALDSTVLDSAALATKPTDTSAASTTPLFSATPAKPPTESLKMAHIDWHLFDVVTPIKKLLATDKVSNFFTTLSTVLADQQKRNQQEPAHTVVSAPPQASPDTVISSPTIVTQPHIAAATPLPTLAPRLADTFAEMGISNNSPLEVTSTALEDLIPVDRQAMRATVATLLNPPVQTSLVNETIGTDLPDFLPVAPGSEATREYLSSIASSAQFTNQVAKQNITPTPVAELVPHQPGSLGTRIALRDMLEGETSRVAVTDIVTANPLKVATTDSKTLPTN